MSIMYTINPIKATTNVIAVNTIIIVSYIDIASPPFEDGLTALAFGLPYLEVLSSTPQSIIFVVGIQVITISKFTVTSCTV